jgi:hypothetical protein
MDSSKPCLLAVLFLSMFSLVFSQETIPVFPGATEKTPSRAQYFSWINNTNEGSTEKQTMTNLDFFKWLQDTYGMVLDIYAFDAGNIDGKGFCGTMSSDRFKFQFPRGFDPIYEKAKSLKTSLGIWGGPDCFGLTDADQKARINLMVDLCKKYQFSLFKFDAVNGNLRTEKQDAFIEMMQKCRQYSPNLILLNHRLNLGKGLPYATTFLFEGAETYIDVHMANTSTSIHHRQGALSRGLVPGLQRLTEDHGVCISSCIDNWDDDLVLQAFNRSLILSPEIYGNPWFLRDDEYPKLARIYNLHKRFANILVNGKLLPQEKYGEKAVSRGDETTRFITLRNLDWISKTMLLELDEEIGLTKGSMVEVRQLHPTEKVLGKFKPGTKVAVEVLPFHSSLFVISTIPLNEIAVEGCAYSVLQDIADQPVKINLMGLPGTSANIKLPSNSRRFTKAVIDGKPVQSILQGKSYEVNFTGKPLSENWHRKLADLTELPVPDDAQSLYEATCFAADNNALEVRSLERSGATNINQVQKARDAFFNQPLFVQRALWDKNLFDGDTSTGFNISRAWGVPPTGVFRLDLGELTQIDQLVLKTGTESDIHPLKFEESATVEVSADLKNWEQIRFITNSRMVIKLNGIKAIRYLRFRNNFSRLQEIEGYKNGQLVDRKKWRASNLFASWQQVSATKAWSSSVTLSEIAKGSYLCVALNGEHGVEGAYASLRMDSTYIGSPDRSVSFPSNTWESPVRKSASNYTYYIPLTEKMIGKKLDVVVLGLKGGISQFKPEVWITTDNAPFEKKELILE